MWTWIKNNPSTIVIAALLVVALVAIAIKLRKDKKQGKSTCGGNCQACGMCAKYRANAAANTNVATANTTSATVAVATAAAMNVANAADVKNDKPTHESNA